MTFPNGVIIGKFAPLHNGHVRLMHYATQHCGYVYVVLVNGKGPQYGDIPITTRAEWLLGQRPFVHYSAKPTNIGHIILEPKSDFPELDDERWALATITTIGVKPDALFSHDYIRDKRYAMAMGAAFVVPPFEPEIRATILREAAENGQLHHYRDHLPIHVQEYYRRKGKL